MARASAQGISGAVTIGRTDPINGACGDAWMVLGSNATYQWGPMLYDLAMEYATENGGGLMSDRGMVSSSARNVWDYYMSKRSDVKGIQMDDLKNTLTPDEQDNCTQVVASYEKRGEIPKVRDWQGSALSKRYTKTSTITSELEDKNKLVYT